MNHTLRCIAFVLVILAGAAACRPAERVTGQSENSASPAAPESPDFVFVSTIEGLYLRETPDMRGKVIALLPFGAEVTPGEETGGLLELQGAKGKWTRVRSEMGEGWVFGAFLRRRSNTSGLITGEYFLGSIFPPSLTIDGRGTFNLRLERHAPSASGDVLIDGTGKTCLLRLDAKTVEFESGGADPEIWRSSAIVFAIRSPGHLEYLNDAPSGDERRFREEVTGQFKLKGNRLFIRPETYISTARVESDDVVRQTPAARSQAWIELGDLDSFFPSSAHGDFGMRLKTLSFSPEANLFSASESPVLFE
jgi:hypothetical protein